MPDHFAPTDLILVVIVPSPRDLEIARLLGWYRIPLRSAPKIIDVDYLAFYQTSAFGEEHKWKIEYYAQVQGHELTRRAELLQEEADHPRAQEEYYKISIGPVFKLISPIKVKKWKRITFLFTTGERMSTASEISDLVVHDDERNILWSALRERALKNDIYRVKEFPEFPMEPSLLAMLGDLKFIKETRWTDKGY